MAPSLTEWLAAPLLHFDTLDSTNNYAMALVNADTALPGTTIVADRQTAGRGQRGRQWADSVGESLLMSVVVVPQRALTGQFGFSAAIALALAETLQDLLPAAEVRIKWPNDIYVNDRKAGGMLIENVIRGSQWTQAVVGFGLNVAQPQLPEALPFATSLRREGGEGLTVERLIAPLREAILQAVLNEKNDDSILEGYNCRLWRRGAWQPFGEAGETWSGRILAAGEDGTLLIETEDGARTLRHGEAEWLIR